MEVAAVGMVTGWGESAAALPPDAVRAGAGRRLIAARRSKLSPKAARTRSPPSSPMKLR